MRKKFGFLKKSVASFELGMLIVSLFAFGYMIYSVDVVEAKTSAASNFLVPSQASADVATSIKGTKLTLDASKIKDGVKFVSGGFVGRVVNALGVG